MSDVRHSALPSFITHYSRGEPFRSMTSLPPESWQVVVKSLNETNAWGTARFSDPEYLPRRLDVEARLRKELIAKGGNPVLKCPIYFFLGRSRQFETHERNQGFIIRLSDIPDGAISFTYGDSLLGCDDVYRSQSGEAYRSPLCGKVFRLAELENLVSLQEFRRQNPLHIEAQLWIAPSEKIVSVLSP